MILSHGMAFRSLFLKKSGAKVCNPFFRAKYITRIFNNTKNTPHLKNVIWRRCGSRLRRTTFAASGLKAQRAHSPGRCPGLCARCPSGACLERFRLFSDSTCETWILKFIEQQKNSPVDDRAVGRESCVKSGRENDFAVSTSRYKRTGASAWQ